MASLKPSRLNKFLAGLFCASLWRKGALCCTVNCSCFNDVENPEAERHRAQGAKWNYRSEQLAARKESREKASQRRQARKEAKQNRSSGDVTKADEKKEHSRAAVDPSKGSNQGEAAVSDPSKAGIAEDIANDTPIWSDNAKPRQTIKPESSSKRDNSRADAKARKAKRANKRAERKEKKEKRQV